MTQKFNVQRIDTEGAPDGHVLQVSADSAVWSRAPFGSGDIDSSEAFALLRPLLRNPPVDLIPENLEKNIGSNVRRWKQLFIDGDIFLNSGRIKESAGELIFFNDDGEYRLGDLDSQALIDLIDSDYIAAILRDRKGDQGEQGLKGLQGTQGLQGEIADPEQGGTGIQGIGGLPGPQGAQGAQGVQGLTGVQGTQGTTGTTGLTGPQGTQGVQGLQGLTGEQVDAVQGICGCDGVQGEKGPQGENGLQGLQGNRGTRGPQGAQGIASSTQGLIGQAGFKGSRGERGVQGNAVTYTQGVQGLQGITGYRGDRGPAGENGTQLCSIGDLDDVTTQSFSLGIGEDTLMQTNTLSGYTFAVGICAGGYSGSGTYITELDVHLGYSAGSIQGSSGSATSYCNVYAGSCTGINNCSSGICANTVVGARSFTGIKFPACANTIIGSCNAQTTASSTCFSFTTILGHKNQSISANAPVEHSTIIGSSNRYDCTTSGATVIGFGNCSSRMINGVAIGNHIEAGNNDYNVSIGLCAGGGGFGTNSSNSVLIGHCAGIGTNGSFHVGIGERALTNPALNSNTRDVFAIGCNSQASSADACLELVLGNNQHNCIRANVTTISGVSDCRDKSNIANIPHGIDFIKDLRPVTFEWTRRDSSFSGVCDIGFIAQELQQVESTHNSTQYTRLVSASNPDKLEATPHRTYPIVVKAIQDLSNKINRIREKIDGAAS